MCEIFGHLGDMKKELQTLVRFNRRRPSTTTIDVVHNFCDFFFSFAQ